MTRFDLCERCSPEWEVYHARSRKAPNYISSDTVRSRTEEKRGREARLPMTYDIFLPPDALSLLLLFSS